MMTREDMLRELELLPVWRLRAPAPELAATPVATAAPDIQIEAVTPVAAEAVVIVTAQEPALAEVLPPVAAEPATVATTAPVLVRYAESSDAHWLFVLPVSPLAADAELLLNNIFNAMRIKVGAISAPVTIADLKQTPKMMVALGESVAQAMLQTDANLQQLRGKLHQMADGTPLLASYDVAQLLTETSYKRMLWADLCLAMQALKD